jgi:hypothetical protein
VYLPQRNRDVRNVGHGLIIKEVLFWDRNVDDRILLKWIVAK